MNRREFLKRLGFGAAAAAVAPTAIAEVSKIGWYYQKPRPFPKGISREELRAGQCGWDSDGKHNPHVAELLKAQDKIYADIFEEWERECYLRFACGKTI